MKIWVTLLLAISCLTVAKSQSVSNLKLGEWDNILPYKRGTSVAFSEEFYYWGTPWSLMRLRISDLSPSFFAIAQGLHNSDIAKMEYHTPTKTLLIAYKDGSFDLWDENSETAVFIPDIKNNTQLIGDRSIKHINFDGDIAYLSTDFGILAFDMREQLFVYTLKMPERVFSSAIFENNIYIGTGNGIRRAVLNSSINYQDISNWVLLNDANGLPANYSSKYLQTFDNQLFASINNKVYRLDELGITLVYEPENEFIIEFLSATGPHLLVGANCPETEFCASDYVMRIDSDGLISLASGTGCANRCLSAIETPSGIMLLADEYDGFRFGSTGQSCNQWAFNSPYWQVTSDIAIGPNGDIAVGSGLLTDNFSATSSNEGFFIRRNNEWETNNANSNPVLVDSNCTKDFVCVGFDPNRDAVYAGGYWGGLVETTPEGTKVYNDTNSSLRGDVGDPSQERVIDLAFDEAGNLWMTNYSTPRPIVLRRTDGTWASFTAPFSRLAGLTIDRNGHKWFVSAGANPGLLVFDDNGTNDNETDDKYRSFFPNTGVLKGNPLCVAADIDGNVWVGTRDGAVRYSCGGDLDQCFGDAPNVILDGIPAVLLDDQEVRAIAIDGANRKWFGTSSGLFLVSSDGQEQLAFYNTENSPMLDNGVTSLAIDPVSGLVYVGSKRGISVLRGEATNGGAFNSPSAFAYPNPVQPGYEGPIAIKGLATNADVKITDINGQLIWEGTALGGQAVWDGKDYTGRNAATGVYMVFCTATATFGSPDVLVTKIAVVRD